MFSEAVNSVRVHIKSNFTAKQLAAFLYLIRPHQWVKNGFLLAPLLFSGSLTNLPSLIRAIKACFCFCLLSSGVYVLNDLIDVNEDKVHPTKRKRPIASGRIPIRSAILLAIGLMGLSISWAFNIGTDFGLIAASYLMINVLYTFKLKHLVILDVFSIATGFILRVLGGAAAISVMPSHWILICTGLLALFLGFSKRRHEITNLDEAVSHRAVLSEYNPYYLDQMLLVIGGATIISYVLYTISPQTIARLGDRRLLLTVPFVLYGLFRYQYLIYHRGDKGDPTRNLLADKPILIDILLWAFTAIGAIYL
ncbi:TPA: decaprenyl-phosphate phosphoribosyltransferase [Candidatus Poribacteria bacterium]|nr:decaprenyl-phosphate phosphoribosyltransferase [Candidatus Poribacteria bacterium]